MHYNHQKKFTEKKFKEWSKKARKLRANFTDEKLEDLFDYVLNVPTVHELISPIIAIIPLQLLAYYISEFLGKDVDQPRNLAKSVTVE